MEEIRINNGVSEIKTDQFTYEHKQFKGRDKVFDLYTDFEKIKEHFIKYNFLSRGGFINNWEKYKKDIENTTLYPDEYFIGVDMNVISYQKNGETYQPVYSQMRIGGGCFFVYIFYTNYGNILEIEVEEQDGGFEPLRKYIVIKNDRKLNYEQINLFNSILSEGQHKPKCVYFNSSFINYLLNAVIYKYIGIKTENVSFNLEAKKGEKTAWVSKLLFQSYLVKVFSYGLALLTLKSLKASAYFALLTLKSLKNQLCKASAPRIRSRVTDTSSDALSCVICLEASRNASLIHGETAHLCCCLDCAKVLKGKPCPMCRETVETVLKTFS